jgi:hypothetical protein
MTAVGNCYLHHKLKGTFKKVKQLNKLVQIIKKLWQLQRQKLNFQKCFKMCEDKNGKEIFED